MGRGGRHYLVFLLSCEEASLIFHFGIEVGYGQSEEVSETVVLATEQTPRRFFSTVASDEESTSSFILRFLHMNRPWGLTFIRKDPVD